MQVRMLLYSVLHRTSQGGPNNDFDIFDIFQITGVILLILKHLIFDQQKTFQVKI